MLPRRWRPETTFAITEAVGRYAARSPWPCFSSAATQTWPTISGHWLEMGKEDPSPAKNFFHVNWFRKGADGKFLWPGYGENARVLKWMFERIEGKGAATETPIGALPTENAITLDGINVSRETMNELLRVRSRRLGQGTCRRSRKIFRDIWQSACPRGLNRNFDRLGQRLQRMTLGPPNKSSHLINILCRSRLRRPRKKYRKLFVTPRHAFRRGISPSFLQAKTAERFFGRKNLYSE